MSEDDATRTSHGFIAARLLGMPMGIDQSVYAVVAGAVFHGLQKNVGIRSKAAVNHQRAVFTAHRHDIATRALE